MSLDVNSDAVADITLFAGAKTLMALSKPKKWHRICGIFENCRRVDCGICINCLDKPEFGKRGLRQQKCEMKHCSYEKSSSPEFIDTVALSRKPRRRHNCGICEKCQQVDCGICIDCLDKPKFGGKGTRKQKCKARTCKQKCKARTCMYL